MSASEPPAPAPKKNWFARHKFLTVLGAIILVAIVAAALGRTGGDGSEEAGTTPAAEGSSAETPAEPGLGDTVTVGEFEYTVTAVDEAGRKVGGEYLETRAQGRFVSVELSVRNIGDEAELFSDSMVELRDADGRVYSSDSTANLYGSEDDATWFSDINPGNAVSGVLYFDLPEGVGPVVVIVHGGMFGGGEAEIVLAA